MYTARLSEMMYPLAAAYAGSVAIGTHTSAYVSLRDYHRAWAVLNVGDMAATATLNVSLLQATTVAGAGSKAITGKAITQLTQAGGDSDSLICIELQTEELDVDGGFDCIAMQAVVGTAAVELSYALYGCVPRFPPVPITNWTEIVG